MKAFIFATACIVHASASWNCWVSTGTIPDLIRGQALGNQANQNLLTTDCYLQSDRVASLVDKMFNSVLNIQLDTWSTPINLGNQAIVETSDMNVACNARNLNKQFNTRLTSWSGVMDLLYKVGSSGVKVFLLN